MKEITKAKFINTWASEWDERTGWKVSEEYHKQFSEQLEYLINQEVERRIAETVAGKFIAVEIEKRIADRQLTDEQIERQFTTSHYHYEKGHYYKVRKDRIFGAKWYRDRLVSQKTDNLKENNNNGSTN